MIKLVRIDGRLMHGQVVFAWVRATGVNHIMVVNEKAVKDDFKRMSLNLSKPPGITLDILDVEGAAKKLNGEGLKKKAIMIILDNVRETKELADLVPEIKAVNYGGVTAKEGSKRFSQAVFLTEEEAALSRELAKKGISLEIRQVPTDKGVILNDLL